MKFSGYVKSVKHDVVAGELTLTFTVPVSGNALDQADQLSQYAHKDTGEIEVEVHPHQLPMFGGGKVEVKSLEWPTGAEKHDASTPE